MLGHSYARRYVEVELVGLCRIAMNEIALTCIPVCYTGDSNLIRGVDTAIEIFQKGEWAWWSPTPNNVQSFIDLRGSLILGKFSMHSNDVKDYFAVCNPELTSKIIEF